MITVYTRSGCPQCTMTERVLDTLGVDHMVVELDGNPFALSMVKDMGYTSAPVVVNGDESWAGFRPDKLNELPRSRSVAVA